MSTIPLQKFIESVPVCVQTDSLATVWSRLSQSNRDRLVLVNEQQQPLGLISLRSFMLLLTMTSHWEPNWQQPIAELSLPSLEPLRIVSANLSLHDFWAYLREQEPAPQESSLSPSQSSEPQPNLEATAWEPASQQPDSTRPRPAPPIPIAVVDPSGKFLGLLDSLHLLQFLAVQEFSNSHLRTETPPIPDSSVPSLDIDGRKPSLNHLPSSAKKSHRQTQSNHSQTPVKPPVSNPKPRGNSGHLTGSGSTSGAEVATADAAYSIKSLHLLIQLLEQLPVPLRLQTSTGQIISQNQAWRTLVGTGPDPAKEAVKAATRARWQPTHPSSPDPTPHQDSTFFSDLATPSRLSVNPAPLPPPAKQSRRTANTPCTQSQVHPDSHSLHPIIQSSHLTVDAAPATTRRQPLKREATAPETLREPNPSTPWCRPGATPNTYVCTYPHQTGSERVWQLIEQPLTQIADIDDLSGTSATDLWLVIAQDVTEQELVAKELAAKNADLIQLNRLKDEFLACISHELKTPLTAILGLSSLLQERVLGELSDRQARYAKLIHQSGRHLMAVVNDILDLTRMETGQLELLLEPVQIRTACERAFEIAEQLQFQDDKPLTTSPSQSASSKGAQPPTKTQFTLEIEPNLTKIVADELRLRQMLVNLLSNALKFTESGGEIGLKVSQWEAWIAFTVWDTGIGIPPDKQHLIFQKFQQLESPLTRRFQGTGLGLVLTQRLARLHGGDVSFISKEDQGSQFTLLLPPSPPVGATAESGAGSDRDFPRPHSRSRLVLIVEAVPQFIEDLSNLLVGLGYRVVIARSGTEALEKARRFSPETIFLNPLLPLLSGWDVLTLLKTDADTRHIPVVITATRGDKERATLNRADGFLSLPVKETALRQQLDELIVVSTDATTASLKASVTILWLSPAKGSIKQSPEASHQGPSEARSAFSPQLQAEIDNLINPSSFMMPPCHCRVLEADDLNQAELLARIWQPDVMILESSSHLLEPIAFVQELSQCPSLAALPLITLDPATTQAANQVQGLSVFPYLGTPGVMGDASEGTQPIASALLEVIQVAAGMTWKPTILAIDVSTLPDLPQPSEGAVPPFPLSPMIQYLQRAGFRGLIGRSWAEVLQQLQYQSVDLLLIYLRDRVADPSCSPGGGVPASQAIRGISTGESWGSPVMSRCEVQKPSTPAAAVQAFSTLGRMGPKPPIVVLDQRMCREGEILTSLLQKIATRILPPSMSMAELLEEIRLILKGLT